MRSIRYISRVLAAAVAERIERWAPRSGGPAAGAFARQVVVSAEPGSWPRARSLLWAASRLCAFALDCGLEPEPGVVLSRSVIERFIVVGTPHWSGPGRRTLRSNLLFLARRVLDVAPDPVPLGRERAQTPYTEAELAASLALADTQPTASRRQRASGLIALGAGAGLIGTDLRLVTGHHVHRRSGGVVVEVKGQRPRVVPVRARSPPGPSAPPPGRARASSWAGPSPTRRNVTTPLIASLAGGADLPRLPLARLRSTWCARGGGRHRPARLHGPRPGSAAPSAWATWWPPSRWATRPGPWPCSAGHALSGPGTLARLESILDASGVAERIEALLPVGVRPRQLRPPDPPRRPPPRPGRRPPGPPDQGASTPWSSRSRGSAAPRGRRRLEDRRPRPDLPPGRAHLLARSSTRSGRSRPTARPAAVLQGCLDALSRRACPNTGRTATGSSPSTGPTSRASPPAGRRTNGAYRDPDASWGHRKGGGPGEKDELFFGYYLQLATMVRRRGRRRRRRARPAHRRSPSAGSTRRRPSCRCSIASPTQASPWATCSATRATPTGSPSTGRCGSGARPGPSW